MSDERASWPKVLVRDLISHHASGPSPTCEERPTRDREWGLLKTTAVTWERGWDAMAHKVPPARYWSNRALEVHDGDVIVTKAGPRHRVGVVAHVDQTQPHLMVSGKMILLRPDVRRINSRVFAGLLAQRDSQKYLDSRTAGMAESQVNFSNAALLELRVPLPPLEEQRWIAEILDTADETITGTQRLVAKLTQQRDGLREQLLREAATFDEWNETALQDLATAPICYGIVQPGRHDTNGVPVVTIGDLDGSFGDDLHRAAPAIEAKYTRSRVGAGDVLVSVKATIGRIAVVPTGFSGNISRDVARVRPGPQLFGPFLLMALQGQTGQRLLHQAVVGTTRAEVSIGALKRIRVGHPAIEDQKRLVAVDHAASHRIECEVMRLAKLRALRSGLARDLLTGRVRTVPV